jgi:hypothetical protein
MNNGQLMNQQTTDDRWINGQQTIDKSTDNRQSMDQRTTDNRWINGQRTTDDQWINEQQTIDGPTDNRRSMDQQTTNNQRTSNRSWNRQASQPSKTHSPRSLQHSQPSKTTHRLQLPKPTVFNTPKAHSPSNPQPTKPITPETRRR